VATTPRYYKFIAVARADALLKPTTGERTTVPTTHPSAAGKDSLKHPGLQRAGSAPRWVKPRLKQAAVTARDRKGQRRCTTLAVLTSVFLKRRRRSKTVASLIDEAGVLPDKGGLSAGHIKASTAPSRGSPGFIKNVVT
jgi:hypothetical protein